IGSREANDLRGSCLSYHIHAWKSVSECGTALGVHNSPEALFHQIDRLGMKRNMSYDERSERFQNLTVVGFDIFNEIGAVKSAAVSEACVSIGELKRSGEHVALSDSDVD